LSTVTNSDSLNLGKASEQVVSTSDAFCDRTGLVAIPGKESYQWFKLLETLEMGYGSGRYYQNGEEIDRSLAEEMIAAAIEKGR